MHAPWSVRGLSKADGRQFFAQGVADPLPMQQILRARGVARKATQEAWRVTIKIQGIGRDHVVWTQLQLCLALCGHQQNLFRAWRSDVEPIAGPLETAGSTKHLQPTLEGSTSWDLRGKVMSGHHGAQRW
eukprot:Skav211542  [mRNA]  locus=scaffold352:506001:509829:+ [translate_table: standard]